MNDICIEVDYSQLYKNGQRIGGDVFLLNKNEGNNVVTATLSDGLGSGVKANVLASLTAHMANKMSFSEIDIIHSAEIIMDVLPVDKEKGISYSTFTIARISYSPDKSSINVNLIEYDNPSSLRFSGTEPVEWKKTINHLNRSAAVKKETVYSSTFSMKHGDRLIFFSDGVAQAGVSLGTVEIDDENNEMVATKRTHTYRHPEVGPLGWGESNVQRVVLKELAKNPDISSRDLARSIVTQAYKYDNYKPNDDITCVVAYIRKARRTLIVTGAPRSKDSDKILGEIISNFEGRVIVCGGTTAKIIARELGKEVKSDKSPSGNLPPSSIIEGIDLVTEGMLTLSAVTDRLTKKTLLKEMPEDAAKRFIKILRYTDQVQFVVGTKINDETSDPNLAAKIGIRLPLIEQMTRALENNYFIEVAVKYL